MATLVQKITSFGNDVATITATTDTILNVYTNIAYTCTTGTLTVQVSVLGSATLTRNVTTAGSLIVPSNAYLVATAEIYGSWVP